MPYKIKDGKKYFHNQHPNDFHTANVTLLKPWEVGNKVFPKGWRLNLDRKTRDRFVAEGKAEAYVYEGPQITVSTVNGETIEKEEKDSKK